MWTCSNCKADFESEQGKCPNCGYEGNRPQVVGQVEWLTVTTVSNDIEFELVAGLLKMADIPAIKKTKGIDSYVHGILGINLCEIDVVVPGDRYEDALELLNTPADDYAVEDETGNGSDSGGKLDL